MHRLRGLFILAALAAAVIAIPVTAVANGDNDLSADPWIFVGTAEQCGIAGSRIVTSAWLGGMGLPDDGGNNGVAATRNDPHLGLLLNKNGPTPDCSSSGAEIRGVAGMVVDADFALGYDIRNGTHCGAGAPRFNVVADPPLPGPNTFHFVGGCANSTLTQATQDPLEWTTAQAATDNPAQAFPPILPGSRIVSIDIVYDEGTDTPSTLEPAGVGLAVIDNIFVDGRLIPAGSGIEPDGDDSDDHDDHEDDDDD